MEASNEPAGDSWDTIDMFRAMDPQLVTYELAEPVARARVSGEAVTEPDSRPPPRTAPDPEPQPVPVPAPQHDPEPLWVAGPAPEPSSEADPPRKAGPEAEPPLVWEAAPEQQPQEEHSWTFRDILFGSVRAAELQEMRESEPDDPCEPTVRSAGILRRPGVVVLVTSIGGEPAAFATGATLAFPLGLIAASLIAKTTTREPGRERGPETEPATVPHYPGLPLRATIAFALEAVDLVTCAEEGRLARCRVLRDWRAPTFEAGLDWCAEILAQHFGVELTDELKSWLVGHNRRADAVAGATAQSGTGTSTGRRLGQKSSSNATAPLIPT